MIRNERFVFRDIHQDDIQWAKEIRASRDKMYGNIYREHETDERWVGDLGEIVINDLLTMCSKEDTTWYTSDVAGKPDFSFYGTTFDVKTVKRKVDIQRDYGAQISAKHKNTKMDYIVFCCYQTRRNEMMVLGAIEKKRFLEIANYYGPGDKVHKDYEIREGHEIYSVPIYELIPFRDFVRDVIYKHRQKT